MKNQQDDDSNDSGFGHTNKEDTEKIHQNFRRDRSNQQNKPLYWQPGKKLKDGKYIIEKMLGRGGFGVTYLVKSQGNKKFVVKTPRPRLLYLNDSSDTELELEGFKLFGLLHTVQNPHIVKLIDTIREDGLPGLVMEYVKGKNLEELVDEKGILQESEAIHYIRQIGEALQLIHQINMLHRDVKPKNIIIRDSSLEAVLIDFGIARHFTTHDQASSLTVRYSTGYAPFEQYSKAKIQREFTDVYGLAATLYFCLTGEAPIESLILEKDREQLTTPNTYNPYISEQTNSAIMKGLEFEGKNRPQSVEEWLDLLPKPESKKTVKSSPPQHNPPRRSRPAPVPPPIPNPPVIQQEKLPSSPVTDWGLYGRTALMGAGVWLIAIAIFNSQPITNQGIWIAVGIILWGISLFLNNHSSLGQKILQHIFSIISYYLIYLFLRFFLKMEASSIVFLAPISGILAMTMMAMAELFINGDSE
ncbi:serine/threonine protein kinase [Planktothrix mougeotii]|uniref:Serine/threonine protein kinase n=1 Tax=Planktothrix mougeotii LEGE 06226 TaxID=1828728 RepID=A0ABR9U9L9_9CYAN|nr:serine/threonine-protein kinase [Planktothrix mougeotii]MBE9143137.1 serine/threonine protein kinase [Planktothrix mougeotii LEGE 06226]